MLQQARNHERRSGAAAVEVALVLMVLLVPLLLGVWEVGRLITAQQIVMNAAREGGRQASTANRNNAWIKDFILHYLQAQGFNKITALANSDSDLNGGGKVFVDVNVFDDSGNLRAGVDASNADQNNRIQITIAVMYKDIEISPTNFYLSENTRVRATVNWNCMRDVPLTVNQTIPLK